jgi:hypothetical protein
MTVVLNHVEIKLTLNQIVRAIKQLPPKIKH